MAPRRQVEECIKQCADLTADDGYFATLVAGRQGRGRRPRRTRWRWPRAAARGRRGLPRGSASASAPSCSTPRPRRTPAADERYQLMSRYFLGATVDLEETYRWGSEEWPASRGDAAGRRADQAGRDRQGGHRRARGRPRIPAAGQADELKAWMQTKADEAIAQLAGTSTSTSPRPMRTIECMIAPTETGRHLLHRAQRGLQPARAGCGGRSPRASPSSAPGAS